MASKPRPEQGTPAMPAPADAAQTADVVATPRPKCPKGVAPSKLKVCSKFVPLSPEQPDTCGRCLRTLKSA